MYSERVVTRLNAIAHKYRDNIMREIQAVLKQPKYMNTGAAANSIQVKVIEGNKNHSPSIEVTFSDYLIVLNKSKVSWTKLPEIKPLLAWAERKTDTIEKATKLAWAIAWDKRKHDTWKAKPWRKKSLSEVLKEMNLQIVEAFAKALDADMQQAIDEGLK